MNQMQNVRIHVVGSPQGDWDFIRPVTQFDIDASNVVGNWFCQQPDNWTNDPCNNVAPGMEDFDFETWVDQGMP